MRPAFPMPAGVAEAEAVQDELRGRLVFPPSIEIPRTVTGLDISYAVGSERAVAAAVVLDVTTREAIEVSLAAGQDSFPYVPGLLAFREIPLLLEAIGGLTRRPEAIVCDGYGVAHPRRFGLADATDLTVRLSGRYRIPEPTRQADILSRRALRGSR